MKVGDKVEGIMFELGTVLALGSAGELISYDKSGAVSECLTNGTMTELDDCVAVALIDARVGLYRADEVWEDLP
jgi:hypothetical protein